MFEQLVYLLCVLTSLVCLVLLARGYRRTGVRLLLWCALCFVCFAVNNLALFVDVVLLPDMDLRPLRTVSFLGGLAVLIYGFVWDAS